MLFDEVTAGERIAAVFAHDGWTANDTSVETLLAGKRDEPRCSLTPHAVAKA